MRLFDRLVTMLVLAVGCYGLATMPAPSWATLSAAPGVCTPIDNDDQDCVEAPGLALVQRPPAGLYAMTDAQFTALNSLEADARRAVRARHGLTDGDDPRLLTYARSPLRAEVLSRLLAAAAEPADERTDAERIALGWLGEVQRRQNVASTTAALAEYHAFYGGVGPGEHPANACTYVPPSPYQDEYPGPGGRWRGCFAPTGPLDLGPRIPSFDDFQRWGTAANQAAQDNLGRSMLSNVMARDAIVLGSASGVTGVAAATLALVELATGGAIFNALLPFAAQAITVTTATAAIAPAASTNFVLASAALETAAVQATQTATTTIAGASGFSVGLAASVAAVVILALTIAVISTLGIVASAHLEDDLEEAVAAAEVTAVDPVELLETDAGRRTLLTAVQSISLSDKLPSSMEAPPFGAADPVFTITDADGEPLPGVSVDFDFTSSASPGGVFRTGRRSIRSGWFIDPAGELDPTTVLSMPLWDPDPRGLPGGVTTPRAGFDYDAAVTTVLVDGHRRWLATAQNRPGYPVFGSACEDYDADGCWITDRLPYYGTTTSHDQRWAEMRPNAAPDVSIAGPASVPQRSALELEAATSDGDDPALDSDGDPVALEWQVLECPLFAVDCNTTIRHGASQSYTFAATGTYVVRLTAADPFGRTSVDTRRIDVTNVAPVLTATIAGGPETAPVTVSGLVADGPGELVSVEVDWGDGSAPTRRQAPNVGGSLAFELTHSYAESNPDGAPTYPVTITASDGSSTTVMSRTVPVVNTAPYLDVDPPGSTEDLEPGTTVTLSGTAADFGPNRPLTLRATWYDGTVQVVPVPLEGTTRPWTASHTVTAALDADSDSPMVRLELTDRHGARSQAAVVQGVVNRAPAFDDLTISDAVVAGDEVRISGRLADANADAVDLTVEWDDGSPVEVLERAPGAEELDLRHTFAHRGRRLIGLEATDALGLSSAVEIPLDVSGHRPRVLSAAWQEKQTAVDTLTEGRPAVLVVDLAPDPESDQTDAIVDWGDGTSSILLAPASRSTLRAAHQYRDDGRYTVTTQAWDADGQADLHTLHTEVRNAPPVAALRLYDELGRRVRPGETVPIWTRLTAATRADDPGVDDHLTGRLRWGDGAAAGFADARTPGRHTHLFRARSTEVTWTVRDEASSGAVEQSVRVTSRRAHARALAARPDAAAVRDQLQRLPRGDVAALTVLVKCVTALSGSRDTRGLRRSLALTAVASARAAVATSTDVPRARRALARAERALMAGRSGTAVRQALTAVQSLGDTRPSR